MVHPGLSSRLDASDGYKPLCQVPALVGGVRTRPGACLGERTIDYRCPVVSHTKTQWNVHERLKFCMTCISYHYIYIHTHISHTHVYIYVHIYIYYRHVKCIFANIMYCHL